MIVEEIKYREELPGLMQFDIARIPIDNLQEFVSVAFKDDSELLTEYSHYSTMEELIETNVANTVELAKTKEVKCYGMFLEQTPIGFTVLSDKLLYSFGINVYCRQKEVKAIWLNWLNRLFDNNFVVCLYRKNTRAINYFLKNGFEEFSEDDKVIYLLTNKS